MEEKEATVTPLIRETYLAVIQNSLGSNTFRNYFALVNNEKQDILRDGELSCAFFVSSLLLIFGLTKESHCTVSGLTKDMEKSGWTAIDEPKEGAVLVWEPVTDDEGNLQEHIGYYIGDGLAISTSTTSKTPHQHHWKFEDKTSGNTRKIAKIYWHEKIG